MLKIAIDAMSGDHGVDSVIPGALAVLRENSELFFLLVGDTTQVHIALSKYDSKGRLAQQYRVVHASEVVEMNESPAKALRSKKDSSLRVAIELVKSGEAGAVVSSGNTGALMATARFVLGTLPGIDRPAIMTRFPSYDGHPVRVLDLGANVDASAQQLHQFAVMGSVVASEVGGIARPTVGLLNIGEEEIKGNDLVKATHELLGQNSLLNYIGYVEGNDIFTGKVDVVVCDGFVGNAVLKACEGMSRCMVMRARQLYHNHWWAKLSLLPALPFIRRLKLFLDVRQYNGAIMLGLNGIVIKSHGGADAVGFSAAVNEAVSELAKQIPEKIGRHTALMLQEERSL